MSCVIPDKTIKSENYLFSTFKEGLRISLDGLSQGASLYFLARTMRVIGLLKNNQEIQMGTYFLVGICHSIFVNLFNEYKKSIVSTESNLSKSCFQYFIKGVISKFTHSIERSDKLYSKLFKIRTRNEINTTGIRKTDLKIQVFVREAIYQQVEEELLSDLSLQLTIIFFGSIRYNLNGLEIGVFLHTAHKIYTRYCVLSDKYDIVSDETANGIKNDDSLFVLTSLE